MAMKHKHKCFIQIRAHGLRKGVESPAYALYGTLYLYSALETLRDYVLYKSTRSITIAVLHSPDQGQSNLT